MTPYISLKAYFIAHAPAEPWPWFEPFTPKKPVPLWAGRRTDNGEEFFSFERKVIEGTCAHAQLRNIEEITAWEIERDRQRCIQWPAFWALHMMRQS